MKIGFSIIQKDPDFFKGRYILFKILLMNLS